jgi:hypothetical protein
MLWLGTTVTVTGDPGSEGNSVASADVVACRPEVAVGCGGELELGGALLPTWGSPGAVLDTSDGSAVNVTIEGVCLVVELVNRPEDCGNVSLPVEVSGPPRLDTGMPVPFLPVGPVVTVTVRFPEMG